MQNQLNFWEHKALNDFTEDEWEALCDHCGKCCLHKIEDFETGKILFTYVACKYLTITTCQCTQYTKRKEVNPACIKLTPETVKHNNCLPATCAYRLISEGNNLPSWHPLITKNPGSTHQALQSIAHFAIPEQDGQVIEHYIIVEF